MNYKKILFSISLLLIPFFASAKTIIDTDVVIDTTWTKEMSPIVLTKKAEKKDKTFRVVNGAHLTIEEGVRILIGQGMDFNITSECLKGHRGDCYLDTLGEKKLPKLTVKGTEQNPVIFKGNTTSTKAGYWGNLILSSEGNTVKNTIFQGGGKNPESYFVNISKNNFFENNTIKNVGNNAVLMKTSDFKNNIIDGSKGEGIVCDYHTCNIENSVIANTNGTGLKISPDKSISIKNNLFYNNKGVGVKLTKYFEKSAIFENNFFLQNGGGLSIYHNNSEISIKNNNFIENKFYALFSETTSSKTTPIIENNFYNIDLGPQDNDGEFFVTKELQNTIGDKFTKEQIYFAFEKNSKMQNFLEGINTSENGEKEFLEINSNKEIFMGNGEFQGSIFSYDFYFKNLQTKSLKDASIEITIPSDQELFICSIQTGKKSYNFKSLCDKNIGEKSKYKNGKITFPIGNFTALSDRQIYFTVFKKNNSTTKNPTIKFKDSTGTKTISYELGKTSKNSKYIKNSTVAPKITKTSTTRKPSSKGFTRSELLAKKIAMARANAKNKTENKSETVETKTENTQNSESAGYIETGTVFTKIYKGNLYFYLKTEEGKTFKLLGSAKWWDLLDFRKSANKDKEIRAYGEYYIGKDGTRKGIFLTHFHLK